MRTRKQSLSNRSKIPGLTFTFAPETTVRMEFLPNAIQTLEEHGGELKRRMASESRAQYQKLRDLTLFEQLHAAGVFSPANMPTPALSLDTGVFSSPEAAATIVGELNLRSSSHLA